MNRLEAYESFEYQDGRHFRTDHEYGGYEGMDSLHGLNRDATQRSREFIELCDEYLTYPEDRLENFYAAYYGED